MTAEPTESPSDRAFQRRVLCIGTLITLAAAGIVACFLYPYFSGA
ncbi:hypothetical protein [Achromobacter arsenitoxydans]|uniref:Uncharacterized protein n=1 Tax=Achromobacter arsenitoxydans SY8 TaxID=477184 RepID=H0F740_9BURK|nr:hypothetical protein [Achromobacter arsenitoxydans]EHK65954.1 hypothetical protein KYC_12533 [Achromobacter arsenitoxydans SY8]